MKTLTLLTLLALTGCTSIQPIDIQQKVLNMTAIDNAMCDNSGFESYFEHEHYISFKCKNGFNSFVKKD